MCTPDFLHFVEHDVRGEEDKNATEFDRLKYADESVREAHVEILVLSRLVREVYTAAVHILSKQCHHHLLVLIDNVVILDPYREESFHLGGIRVQGCQRARTENHTSRLLSEELLEGKGRVEAP